MFLIVGLGNPGRKYEDTRHNVGFKTIDYLAESLGISVKKIRFKALIGEGVLAGEKVILAKPSTFMNASGESVSEIARYYDIPPQNIIVIQDDVALPVGRIRIRQKGSDGGHNGIKSIIYLLESDQFVRIKIGVGSASSDMVSHVLGTFSKQDAVMVTDCIKLSNQIIETIIHYDAVEAMNRFNGYGKTEAE